MKYKNIALFATLITIISGACTNETESGNGMTPIGIGNIEIGTTAALSLFSPCKGGVPGLPGEGVRTLQLAAGGGLQLSTLTVTATNGATTLANTYTHTSGSWTPNVTTFYLEDVLAEGWTFQATTGNPDLVTDQADATKYTTADYITGPVELNTAARQFATAQGSPLEHRHVDVVLTLTKGNGWKDNPDFASVLAGASISLLTDDGQPIAPYRTAETTEGTATASAVIPSHQLPATGSTIATLTMPGEQPQNITYTLQPEQIVTPGTRLNIKAEYHNHRGLGNITVTIEVWTNYDIPPLESGKQQVIIATVEDLKAFRDRVNNGETYLQAVQIADIDLAGEDEWVPIGKYNNSNNTGYAFTGIYDGGGYAISNMKIKGDYDDAGFFGYVAGEAVLTSIRLESVQMDCTAYYAGALVGYIVGKSAKTPPVISHCTVKGDINVNAESTGGLAGYSIFTHITHCHTQCTITAQYTTTSYNGGLVGYVGVSSVVACSATGTGTINATNSNPNFSYRAGGLVGINNSSSIYFCQATQPTTAEQTSNGSVYAGGCVGLNMGTIISCYATGGATAITEGFKYQGTFIGYNGSNGTINHCHAVPGNGEAYQTSGEKYGYADIKTDPDTRYETLTAEGVPSIYAFTVMRDPTTGRAVLPPVEYEFTATEVWTDDEFPQIKSNR